MGLPRKILLTTSRNPTPRIRTLCNDLTRVLPSLVRVNRGKMSMNEVAEKALEHGADRVIIIDRWQSGPCKIEFFHIGASGLVSVPSVLYIAGLRLQRELVQEKWKHVRGLVITQPEGDSTEIAESLSKFFNIPLLPEKDSSKYSITMHISHNTRGQVQITFMQLPQKVEIGPRITLRRME